MKVERLKEIFKADSRRVILQPFQMNEERTKRILDRVLNLSEENVEKKWEEIKTEYESRHRDFKNRVLSNYKKISGIIKASNISDTRKLLIGAYFSKEYSIESAALFNPSIVVHPDQSGVKPGELKFILSLRATGEGHISSIEFREGIISGNNNVSVHPPTRIATLPNRKEKRFAKRELIKMFGDSFFDEALNKNLNDEFMHDDVKNIPDNADSNESNENVRILHDYTDSNYYAHFDPDIPLSERVLFPQSQSESMGMEDVRFVKFVNDDGVNKYYGTYTAYDGRTFRTQLIETSDFLDFEIKTMTGSGVKDKGLALFPRKINGMYCMISRQDGENLYIMQSDNLYHWDNPKILMTPEFDWEFVQIGNCGSPIETEKGWLLITHAVGAFRKYVISAVLLDRDKPDQIIGKCDLPLLSPDADEREGYVPNVVYSCGSLIKDNEVILPYAMSDSATGFAKIDLEDLLNEIGS